MGLFSSKKIISVSSSLYNLAGEEDGRENYLKSNLFSSVIQNDNNFLGETVISNYLKGPGVKQRQFFNWSVRNDYIGLPAITVQNSSSVDNSIIESQLSTPTGYTNQINDASSVDANYVYFAEKYILENRNNLYNTNWISEYYDNNNTIVIQYEDGSTETIPATGYDKNKRYIIVYYTQFSNQEDEITQYIDKIFIYKIGSGNSTLDNLNLSSSINIEPEFFPFIPVRINNKSIRHSDFNQNGLFDKAEQAYKKFSNGESFNELIDSVEDNEDLDEIDYAYIDYGVILNTSENSSKKYIHEFLRGLIPYQDTDQTYMNSFISNIATYNSQLAAYNAWRDQYGHEPYQSSNPSPPTVISLASPKITTLKLLTDNTLTQSYDVRISWINIQEDIVVGKHLTNALVGDVRLEKGNKISWTDNSIETLYVYRQISSNSFSKITCYGFIHENFIYGSKRVFTDTTIALDDDEDSSFLVPLHYPTLKKMSIVDTTQMATENTYLIVNSYQIFKKKWYQRGIFKILLFITIIIVSVLLNPAAFAGATGLLGTNIAVGTAIGLTGTVAIIAGAAINGLVGMFVAQLITEGATKLFGERFGALIGSILSFVVSLSVSGGLSSFSFNSVDDIMKLGNVLSNAYTGWTASNITDINDQILDNQTEYEKNLNNINSLLKDLGGTNDLFFNPLELTDITTGNGEISGYLSEGLDDFIQRTTMVGSDIVEITLSMVNNYAEIARELPRN